MVKEPDNTGTPVGIHSNPVNRPDKLGLIFDLAPNGGTEFGGYSIGGREVWMNARLASHANRVLRGIAARIPVGVMLYHESNDRTGQTKVQAGSTWQSYQLYGPKAWVKSYHTFTMQMDGVLQPPIPKEFVIGV